MTKPFICVGDDDQTYFVKGKAAGRRSLIAEFVCGRLAESFGLPVAPFEIVEVDERLVEMSRLPDAAELGRGLAFGSKSVRHAQDLHFHQVSRLDLNLRKDVLVFDWWVRNGDRCMTERGGNPNLLWSSLNERLVVIDHNLAFEEDFDRTSFAANHIFSGCINEVFNDLIEQINYAKRLNETLVTLETILDAVPEDWWWAGEGVPALLSREKIRKVLGSVNSKGFWSIEK